MASTDYSLAVTPQAIPFTVFDRAVLLILQIYGAAALIALALVPRYFLPAEDAVILFQYSRNLAQHGAITFMPGGPHTEGATDFAWMLLVAFAQSCGLPPFPFTAVVDIIALLGIAVLILKLGSLRISIAHVLAIVGSAALFPQIFAAASGFAVLPDALLLTATVYFTIGRNAVKASLCALLLCFFRPDGVVIAIPLLIYLVVSSKRIASLAAVCFLYLLPGIVYFFWRWHYFGELFPLPFLVKSDAQRAFGLVTHSVRSSLIYVIFAGLVLYPVWKHRYKSFSILAVILIVIPTLFYWALRLDQNVGDRFFYYLPTASAILVAWHWPWLREQPRVLLRTAFMGWLLLIAMPFFRELRTFRDLQFSEVKSIGEDMSRVAQGTIATSEAGFLPYYSKWNTVDVWGLNNSQFAHHLFQPPDLTAIHPDLLVLHPDRTESCLIQPAWPSGFQGRSWPHLTRNLILAVGKDEYDLWLTSYGSEFYRRRKHWSYGEGDRECWFLRKDSPVRAQLAHILEAHHAVAPIPARRLELARLAPAR